MFTKHILDNNKSQKGFTLIELMLVSALGAILVGLVVFNLLRFQNSSSAQVNTDTLVSDLKSQQIKAMLGNTEGRNANDSYGIYFLSDRYVLFHGNTYVSTDSSNFAVKLPSNLVVQSTTFPSNTIVFTKLSGEIPGFVNGSNTVTLRAVNINKTMVLTLNRYGVVIGD